MIVVNCKTYRQGSAEAATELARICKRVTANTNVPTVLAVQALDLAGCVGEGGVCWLQHVDPVGLGKFSGFVAVESAIANGAGGTILNHSEHKVEISKYDFSLFGRLGFKLCVCVEDIEELERLLKMCKPDYVAYEPKEFIGSRERSVSSERPEMISEVVKIAQGTEVLVGAGVHSTEDVKTALLLGAKGVLVATDVVLADDPEKELNKLASGFKF